MTRYPDNKATRKARIRHLRRLIREEDANRAQDRALELFREEREAREAGAALDRDKLEYAAALMAHSNELSKRPPDFEETYARQLSEHVRLGTKTLAEAAEEFARFNLRQEHIAAASSILEASGVAGIDAVLIAAADEMKAGRFPVRAERLPGEDLLAFDARRDDRERRLKAARHRLERILRGGGS